MAYLIKTPCGMLQGAPCSVPGVAAYKGIRYAVAGRWEYPRKITHWEGVYDATHYGNACCQERTFWPEGEDSFYYNEFRKGDTYTYSEDCLFLNVWTPENARPGDRLPVLVYIHGGAFQGCCAHEKPFDDPVWPTRGVIAVTLNYRVGPLGFACIRQAEQEAGHTGNYGLYDQMTALQWVQDNIAAFGGDSAKVTVMGQSAGAMSVQHHCLSPLSAGLFSRAVLCSGGGALKNFEIKPVRKRMDFWDDVMERAGCEDLEQFRALSAEALFAAWRQAARRKKGLWNHCGPCIDELFITGKTVKQIRAGYQMNIPYMIGTTANDMIRVRLQREARKYASEQALQGKRSSFAWFFDRKLPGDKRGAWHSSDLWYWFGTLRNCWRPMEEKDYALSEQMVSYLTNFARCGDPNGHPLPMWEAGRPTSTRVLHLGEAPTHMRRVNAVKLRLSAIADGLRRR